MKIIEVRDGFIKFESKKKLMLSSFVLVTGINKNYVAQIYQLKRAGENNIAYAKLIFLYDGMLHDYDNTHPSLDSQLESFDFSIIDKTFTNKNSVVIGKFIDEVSFINIAKETFDKKILVSIDTPSLTKKFVNAFVNQFEHSIVIDTLGVFEGEKFIAGKDFKLPLNTESLDFMFEDCLSDATSDSKSLIKDIFQDLADYSKTVPFVPFGTLKTIVDDMVNCSHVFKLLVLKNKLAKFDKLGYFASNVNEAENINKILTTKNAVIDLSKLDPIFQNRYLSVIYSLLEKQDVKPQLFALVANSVNKRSLKKLVTGNLATTIVTHSRFKYIKELSPMFEDFIVEPSFVNRDNFKSFSNFLNEILDENLVLVSKNFKNIPLGFSLEYPMQENVVSESQELALTEKDVIELENALENSDPTIEAIDKKASELIDKVTDEVITSDVQDDMIIFEEETQEQPQDTTESLDLDSQTIQDSELEEKEVILEQESEALVTDLNEESSVSLKESDLIDSVNEPNEEEALVNKVEDYSLSENSYKPQEESINEYHTQIDEYQTIEIPEDISELADEAEQEITMNDVSDSIEETSEHFYTEIADADEQKETTIPDSIDVIPLEESSEDFDVIVELDDTELTDETIIVNFEDDNLITNDVDKEIIEDVDKVFTTIKDDSFSDSDLDFIDELNGEINDASPELQLSEGMEELTELQELESSDEDFAESLEEIRDYVEPENEAREILEKRESSTPIVPVYDADIPAEDTVVSDMIEQGDTVVHAKYGNGVVEKMIKYGTKTLYSINFDNVGRRLLDPTLTEIKKA